MSNRVEELFLNEFYWVHLVARGIDVSRAPDAGPQATTNYDMTPRSGNSLCRRFMTDGPEFIGPPPSRQFQRFKNLLLFFKILYTKEIYQ